MKRISWAGFGNFGLPLALRASEQFIVKPILISERGHAGAKKFLREAAPNSIGIDFEPSESDALVLCLPRTSDVADILRDLNNLPKLIIDLTSGDPAVSTEIGLELAKKSIIYIDCPVSGSAEDARLGRVTMYIGAKRGANETLESICSLLASEIFYFDSVGNGNRVKAINQFMHLSHMALLRHGFAYARESKLDLNTVIEAVKVSSGSCRMLERFGASIVKQNFATQFALRLAEKDLNIVQKEFLNYSVSTEVLSPVLNLYSEAMKQEYGDFNFSIVCKE
jgi:3-hydroxyisobutyrate dehydrogenase-like beta-hydroxyacid dehydrogenase